ncbi:MAG: CDP-diacylglycerol--glycerol-3-phosphate 3-phosphatidyltransferase [Alphaproteobacteria bacterium]|nr:CDP-diacylglycerol--glycerol-3-phosphate 3-phosphatidyltransferase [Alphaproteobacteria bacterium]
MLFNLPNLLTLFRIVAIVPIAGLIYVDAYWANWTAFGLFAAAGITDFFDGYLARSTGQVSKLGRFLDPIADKLLIAAVIFMLVASGGLSGWSILPGLIILVREITVSGLREFLAELRVGMPVSSLAKWKTTIQIFALGFLIVGTASPAIIPSILIGEVLIWLAAALTVVTGFDYLRAGLKHMTD